MGGGGPAGGAVRAQVQGGAAGDGVHGGRGYGPGRGGGRAGGRARGDGGRYGQGGGGYNNHNYNYSNHGDRSRVMEFNPNLGHHPPQYEPGWSDQRPHRYEGGHGGHVHRGRGRNQNYRPVHWTAPHNRTQQQGTGATNKVLPQDTEQQRHGVGTPVPSDQQGAKDINKKMVGQDTAPKEIVTTGGAENKEKTVNLTVLHGSSSTTGGKDNELENRVVGATNVANNGSGQTLQTTKTCRRCGLKGHLLFDCTTEVYCDICRNSEHALCRCPVARQPKPVVQLVGQAVDALAAFHIPHAPIQPVKRDTRYAKVAVLGETMTEEELAEALRLSIKDNYIWEIQKKENSMFKVLFPTRTDLIRATRFNIGLENGATLKFEEYTEDEEYFGHALPVVWMRVLNLPSILREYVVLWALGTLFGVTQEVDIITTNANNFGRFAVAVLEPEAIPTRLDVIIGNRYFQLIFEIEPFQPNIGLKGSSTKANGSQEDKGDGENKDTTMEEKDKNLDGSFGKQSSEANLNNTTEKSSSNKNVQERENMEVDWEQDDVLDQEHELSEAASKFIGVKKGEPLTVLTASALASARTPGSVGISAGRPIAEPTRVDNLDQNIARTKVGGLHGVGTVQPSKEVAATKLPTPSVIVVTEEKDMAAISKGKKGKTIKHNTSTSLEASIKEDKRVMNKIQRIENDGIAAGGGVFDQGSFPDSVLGAGVAADGTSSSNLGSMTVMAALSSDSNGHLTPLRRSIRTAGDTDVDAIEKAGMRVAIKNLEDPQGTLQGNTLDAVLVAPTKGGGSLCIKYGMQDA
ncbi:unnamed protein product [Urochloa humidicola]